MNQLFAVKVQRTVVTETTLYVRAADKHVAFDAAEDFAKANDLTPRMQPASSSVSVYDVQPTAAGGSVDVEV